MRRTCDSCAAFSPLTNECRANPPSAALVQGPIGKPTVLGFYPPTVKDGWCLKHITEEKHDGATLHDRQ